jgi:tripartite-type tricarboxylate transporter receptor subunit TctC
VTTWLRDVALISLLAVSLAACAPATRPADGGAAKPAAQAVPAESGPAQSAAKPAPPDYFAGKTVTLLVGYSPGGPSDVFARLVAQHLKPHIPGNPTLIVEHKPGAGGIVGANYLYSVSKKDGLTIGAVGLLEDRQVMGAEGVQYDVTKFIWLGGAVESQVGFIHPSLGVRTAQDLPKTSDVVVGGLTPESSKDIGLRTFFNLLGTPYKYVTGYPGNADARLAFQRGEINFFEESLTGWVTGVVPLVEQGNAVNLLQRGLPKGGTIVRDPRVPDLPTYLELAVAIRGEGVRTTVEYRAMELATRIGAMQRGLLYPPGVAPEIVEVMREAVARMFADEEFQATSQKQFGFQPEFVPGPQAVEMAAETIRLATEDAEALEYVRRLSKG